MLASTSLIAFLVHLFTVADTNPSTISCVVLQEGRAGLVPAHLILNGTAIIRGKGEGLPKKGVGPYMKNGLVLRFFF
jgi:hypothetical protein